MAKKEIAKLVADEVISGQIYFIRDQKIMVDRDLARLYEVETKRLKEAVKRNIDRFPDDFMFEMTKEEFENWRTQIASSNSEKMGLRYRPFCFTEQGVAMLSSVLNSKRAITVNIQIMRLFTKLRTLLTDPRETRLDIEFIKQELNNHNQNFEVIFKYLDELMEKKATEQPRTLIGYTLTKKQNNN